jgi:hypothetical protein
MMSLIALAGLFMAPAAKADLLTLNTGTSTTLQGGVLIDNDWKVSYQDPSSGTQVTSTAQVVTDSTFLADQGWLADSSFSHWLSPTAFPLGQAPPTSGTDPLAFDYTTTFSLSNPAGGVVGSILADWSSDNNGVAIFLNGNNVWTGDTGETAFDSWHTISIGSGLQAGLNTLTFRVLNQPEPGGSATGFRAEVAVFVTAVDPVPEPGTLFLALPGFALVSFLAWRRSSRSSEAVERR